jgi:hypothetical protein
MITFSFDELNVSLARTYRTVLFLYRTVSEDLNKMRTKEKYMNNQYASLCAEYEQVRINPLPDLIMIIISSEVSCVWFDY